MEAEAVSVNLVDTTNGGYKILRQRKSLNPRDTHLMVVLAQAEDPQRSCPWVTWSYNVTDGGYFLGHYLHREWEALKDFEER
jgi:hypothetical protein